MDKDKQCHRCKRRTHRFLAVLEHLPDGTTASHPEVCPRCASRVADANLLHCEPSLLPIGIALRLLDRLTAKATDAYLDAEEAKRRARP